MFVNDYLSKYRADYNLGSAHPERDPAEQGCRLGRADRRRHWQYFHCPPRHRAHVVLGHHRIKRYFLRAGDNASVDIRIISRISFEGPFLLRGDALRDALAGKQAFLFCT